MVDCHTRLPLGDVRIKELWVRDLLTNLDGSICLGPVPRSLSCLIMALFNSAIAIFRFHFSLWIFESLHLLFQSAVIIALHKYKMAALKINSRPILRVVMTFFSV